MSDLIAQLLTDAPALVETAWAALERGDASEVHRAAHTLKSNAATFGAHRLADMCRELEEMTKDGSRTTPRNASTRSPSSWVSSGSLSWPQILTGSTRRRLTSHAREGAPDAVRRHGP